MTAIVKCSVTERQQLYLNFSPPEWRKCLSSIQHPLTGKGPETEFRFLQFRNPTRYRSNVLAVGLTELAAQRRFFVENDEEVGNCEHCGGV